VPHPVRCVGLEVEWKGCGALVLGWGCERLLIEGDGVAGCGERESEAFRLIPMVLGCKGGQ
jgi:hypothetical protein